MAAGNSNGNGNGNKRRRPYGIHGARKPPLAPTKKPCKPRGKAPEPFPQVGAAEDAYGLTRLVLLHLSALEVKGYSKQTLGTRKRELSVFLDWCLDRSIERPTELTRRKLERYQRHLFHCRRSDGKPLTSRSQHNLLRAMRIFFGWLVRADYLTANPAADIEMPKLPKQLPRDVLNEEEVERVLLTPNVKTPLGLRDRAMLEVLYSTAIRRSELVGLDVYDLDFLRGVIMVRAGKGSKDRVVPIGERALAWTNKYMSDVRPEYVFAPNTRALFLNYDGARLHISYVGHVVRRYLDQAGIEKRGGCHIFRHSAATAMLENGADIRYIQAMLGHTKLETTQVYTHVAITKLKEVHTKTHPARLKRNTESSPEEPGQASEHAPNDLAASEIEQQTPHEKSLSLHD